MSEAIPRHHPLRQLFRAAVERAFQERSELYSPQVEAHLTEELLPDFVHNDRIYRLQSLEGKSLKDLPEMIEVGHEKEGPERSLEVNRYIGDFVLFMCGFFPGIVRHRRWFRPEVMVSRVGGILVSFSRPIDYFLAEGSNAYSRAADTAERFDPDAHETYRQLGENIDGYLGLLETARAFIDDSSPGTTTDEPIIV